MAAEGPRPTASSRATSDAAWTPPPFRPARFLGGAHAQTLAGRYLRRAPDVSFRRERIELPDGDFVDLDHPEIDVAPDAPLVLVMHGLEGSARRGYAVQLYRELAARGVRAAGLNFRSCSGEPNRAARLYHSGDTADIEHVLRLLADREPDAPLGAVGFSLGGNALLKLLGELGSAGPELVTAGAAVSVPYDLGAGADHLTTSAAGRLYTRHFVRRLVAKADARADRLGDVCDLPTIRRARTFREFDDAATAPIHGFDGAADYYTRSSSAAFLPRIEVPTLLVHAADDPFLPAASFPAAAANANPHITPIVTARGGHVGFVGGSVLRPQWWAEETVATWMAATLAQPGD